VGKYLLKRKGTSLKKIVLGRHYFLRSEHEEGRLVMVKGRAYAKNCPNSVDGMKESRLEKSCEVQNGRLLNSLIEKNEAFEKKGRSADQECR